MDDDNQENPTEPTENDADAEVARTTAPKLTFASIVKSNQATPLKQSEQTNFKSPAAAAMKTTSRQTTNSETIFETNFENINEPTLDVPPNSPTDSIDIDLVNMQKRQYFLAEAESAPKHLVRYAAHENLTKLISAYSEQCGSNENTTISTDNIRSPRNDEPSSSKMFKNQTLKREIQSATMDPLTKKHISASIQKALSANIVVNVNTENIESSLMQKSFTTVIAGSTVVIPTAILASKPAESPTPPTERNDCEATNAPSVPSIGSLVCRICHNSENPERLVSPCLCKGSLSYVHIHCLERWISTSRSTVCELCQFQYNTEQTLRYTCIQSLRMWYSRSMSRRALQEDCQMFSLLTLVAFGIIGTLLVGIQYYFIQGRHWGLSSMWTKGWLLFFLFTTLIVYFINIYMIIRSQLAPWYRWWQSARDIKLILENRKPFKILPGRKTPKTARQQIMHVMSEQHPQQELPQQAAATPAQIPIVPHIPTTPINSVVPSTAAGTIAATSTLSMHNKVASNDDAINVSQVTATICGISKAPKTISPSGISTSLQYSNKLQISVELTGTATEIIETPLENFDRCKFEYATAVV